MIQTLGDVIKQNYKNKELVKESGLVDFRETYDLHYIISEKFDVLLPKTPKFIFGDKVLSNEPYILYGVECQERIEIEETELKFKQNYIDKTLERLEKLSNDKPFFIYDFFIFKIIRINGSAIHLIWMNNNIIIIIISSKLP